MGGGSGACETACPANSVCVGEGTGATCNCVVGYTKVNGQCEEPSVPAQVVATSLSAPAQVILLFSFAPLLVSFCLPSSIHPCLPAPFTPSPATRFPNPPLPIDPPPHQWWTCVRLSPAPPTATAPLLPALPSAPAQVIATVPTAPGQVIATEPSVPAQVIATESNVPAHVIATKARVPAHVIATETRVPGHVIATEARVPGHVIATEARVPGHVIATEARVPAQVISTVPVQFSCSGSSNSAKCSFTPLPPYPSPAPPPFSDACYGVKCPDVATCVVKGGTAVCQCPAPFARLIDNVCSSANLAHSEYLDIHNNARAAVGAVPLVWDDTLAAHAQAWATALTNASYNCSIVHGGHDGEGQNLAGASPAGVKNGSDASGWWVNEGQWYTVDVHPNGCAGGNWAKCGHYTQVIWNDTRTLGCAKASCGTGSDVWACHYYPPGNVRGLPPYVQDPCFRVQCPSTSTCSAVDGKPVCVCGVGQALVNSSQCLPGAHLPPAPLLLLSAPPMHLPCTSHAPPMHLPSHVSTSSSRCFSISRPAFTPSPPTLSSRASPSSPFFLSSSPHPQHPRPRPDPCIGVSCPAGDLVCDTSTGTAQCVCPKGTLLVAPNMCLAPVCVGVQCPSTSRCRATKDDIPFCACPDCSSLVNGTCTQAAPATVTTSLVVYNAPNFTNSPASLAPAVLRSPTPGAGCVNIPAAFAGAVGSIKILWDVPDGAAGGRQVCGLMWFNNDTDCSGWSSGTYKAANGLTTFE
ncbi:unnamed protein product [Closterium sp. NIES-65]|nr:unnamed protein product [Closterium sp. NIES-65]